MGGETVENMKRLLHPDTVAEGSERAAPFGCAQCTEAEEVWLCLACRAVGCSRYVGGHGAAHAEASHGHSLAVSLADMSVWCYPCSAYVDVHKVPGKQAVLT
jgi:histone deacetylase 6